MSFHLEREIRHINLGHVPKLKSADTGNIVTAVERAIDPLWGQSEERG